MTPALQPSLASILFDRLGWTDEYLAEVNDPSHPELMGTPEFVEALRGIRERGDQVVVLPDFDTDGVTSGVIAYAALGQLGFDVGVHFPDYRYGHDVVPGAVDDARAAFPDARALLVTDGGTNSHAGIARAKVLFDTVLVTDHHLQLPSPEPLAADVLVNPCRLDETYPHTGICGAHVVYQLVLSYARAHAPGQVPVLERLALFAGLGTVADVMPLLYENRGLVRRSVSLMRLMYGCPDYHDSPLFASVAAEYKKGLVCSQYVDAFAGFGQLLDALREDGSVRDAFLREDLAAFYLAPAVNSARRVLSDGSNAFRVFVGRDPAGRQAAVRAVLADNVERRRLTEEWMEDLAVRDQPLAPYVWRSDAPKGFLGLLASRLSELHDRPVAVVRPDDRGGFSGSARAPEGVDVVSAFAPVPGIGAVGHAQACGVFADASDALVVMADALAALQAARPAPATVPVLGLVLGDAPDADSVRPSSAELLDLVDRIAEQAPFGYGFPEPLHRVAVDPARAVVAPIGQETVDDDGNVLAEAGRHTRITVLDTGLKLLWWNSAAQRALLPGPDDGAPPMEFHVALGANDFCGTVSPQGVVKQRLA